MKSISAKEILELKIVGVATIYRCKQHSEHRSKTLDINAMVDNYFNLSYY